MDRVLKNARIVTSGEAVAIAASCTIGTRDAEPVLVTDLDREGCRLHTAAVGGVSKAQALVLHLPGCAAIAASASPIGWRRGRPNNQSSAKGAAALLRTTTAHDTVRILASNGVPGQVRVVYRADGFARGNGGVTLLAGSIDMCLPTRRPTENVRRITIGSGSRVSMPMLPSISVQKPVRPLLAESPCEAASLPPTARCSSTSWPAPGCRLAPAPAPAPSPGSDWPR